MENNEKVNDASVKSTFINLIKEEMPDMSQEEAIKNYRENDTIVPLKKAKKDADNEENTEESEHLKRIKQELLASLERVKQLAKKVFNEEKVKDDLKVKEKSGKQGGKGLSKQLDNGEKVTQKEKNEKER